MQSILVASRPRGKVLEMCEVWDGPGDGSEAGGGVEGGEGVSVGVGGGLGGLVGDDGWGRGGGRRLPLDGVELLLGGGGGGDAVGDLEEWVGGEELHGDVEAESGVVLASVHSVAGQQLHSLLPDHPAPRELGQIHVHEPQLLEALAALHLLQKETSQPCITTLLMSAESSGLNYTS